MITGARIPNSNNLQGVTGRTPHNPGRPANSPGIIALVSGQTFLIEYPCVWTLPFQGIEECSDQHCYQRRLRIIRRYFQPVSDKWPPDVSCACVPRKSAQKLSQLVWEITYLSGAQVSCFDCISATLLRLEFSKWD